jgi:hypothetical protein
MAASYSSSENTEDENRYHMYAAACEADYLENGQENEDETLESVLKKVVIVAKTKQTTRKTYFGRKDGIHGFVSFSYKYDEGMPPRFPPEKILTIKMIYVSPKGTNTVSTTCDKLLHDPDTKDKLDKIIIEIIQSKKYEIFLKSNGWTITKGEGTSNAEKYRGGRKINENNGTSLSNFKKKQTRIKRKKQRRTRHTKNKK